jgi:hypothetical protein
VFSVLSTPDGIVAGGLFTEAEDSNSISRIARFDGNQWLQVGDGLNNSIRGLYLDGDTLIAVGDFTQSGSETVNRVGRFDKGVWNQIGDGLNSSVLGVTRDFKNDLWVVGSFASSGSGNALGGVAKLNGEQWSSAQSGVAASFSVNTVVAVSNNGVFIGGTFPAIGNDFSFSRIARWDGDRWIRANGIGAAPGGIVNAVAESSDGDIYVGGSFLSVGRIPATRIARWNGSSWSSLGAGLNGTVNSIISDSSGNIYAGGNFTASGTIPLNRIARWDGSSWNPVGTGLNGNVQTMAIGPDGNLYVGGSFTAAGDVTNLNRIARWDGTSWSPVGVGFSATVNAIAFGPGDIIYAGGSFIVSGSLFTSYIARFRPDSGWQAMGEGMSDPVRALEVDSNGRLYVGGDFTVADKKLISRIAYWEDGTFHPVGGGVNGPVYSISIGTKNEIHIAGTFTQSGEIQLRRFARFSGSLWSEVESGVSGSVLSMLRTSNGNFILGGQFDQAGCRNSSFLARYSPTNFTGGVSADWHDVMNWNSGVVPASNSSARVSSADVVITSDDATVRDLTIESGRVLTIESGRTLTVTGSLLLLGQIDGNGTLVLSNCSPESLFMPLTSFVSGSMRRCVAPENSYLFPLGNPKDYLPVTVSGANSVGDVSVSTMDTPQTESSGLPRNRISRIWNVVSSGISRADISFTYTPIDLNGVDEGLSRLYRTLDSSSTVVLSEINSTTKIATAKQTRLTGVWTIAQQDARCATTISGLPEGPLSSDGEAIALNISTTPDCNWSASTKNPWIAVGDGNDRTGSGTLMLTISPNMGGLRSGVLLIGQNSLEIKQLPFTVVSGRVVYYLGQNAAAVPRVDVAALGAIPGNSMTDSTGFYALSNLGLGEYSVSVSKSGDVNGITSADASIVLLAASGAVELSPAQMMAADVTGDGTISAFDASHIARYVVGLPATGLTGTWTFLPPAKLFSSVVGTRTSEDFVAILIGDVTGNWSPNAPSNPMLEEGLTDRLSIQSVFGGSPGFIRKSAVTPEIPTVEVIAGESIRIPIRIGDITSAGAFSFDIELEYDPEMFRVSEANPIESLGTLSANQKIVVNTREPGILRIAAFGTVPLAGNGDLLHVNLQVIDCAGLKKPLRVRSFRLDESVVVPFDIGGNRRYLPTKTGN